MNLSQLLAACYADTGYNSTPATEVTTRFTRWLNDGLYELLNYPGLTDLRQTIIQAASVASYLYLPISPGMARIDNVTDTTNMIRLRMMTRDRLRLIDPGETAVGLPTHWIPYGDQAVFKQPTPGTLVKLAVVSSDAGDTTQIVRMHLLINSGGIAYPQLFTKQLNGVTPVEVNSGSDTLWIQAWSLDSTTTGFVNLYESGAVTNIFGRILGGTQTSAYQILRLWPTPSSAVTYTIEGQAAVSEMASNTDTPAPLPLDFHYLLVLFGKIREYQRTNDDRLNDTRNEFTRGAQKMRAAMMFPADYRPIAGDRRAGINWTNLPGGYFPADGSWP